jgi:hypothetical protein
MNDSKTEVKLLELFDVLSKAFYSLTVSYEKLKNEVDLISRHGQNIIDTKQIVNDIDKDLQLIKQNCTIIEKIAYELQAYQNNVSNVPGQIFEHLHSISGTLSKLRDELKLHDDKSSDAVKKLIKTFDEEFIDSIKKVNDLKLLVSELVPISKVSKIISKPLAMIVIFLTLAITIGGFLFTVLETKKKIETVTTTIIENFIKDYQDQKNKQISIQKK